LAQRLSALASAYQPRRSTETALHSLVRKHFETFLAHTRESYGAPLPKYVENEFREYLRCGDFADGFFRARCESCDHDLLVAFSCKLRGVCPSCAGRRMGNTAAFLVDRVVRVELIRDSDESNAPASMSPTETLTALGMQQGTLVTMRDGAERRR
jgi:hypothetical protein